MSAIETTPGRRVRRRWMERVLAYGLVAAACAAAQAAMAAGPDDVTLAEYLGLLGSVAPAAREGAERYLGAFRARCGRDMAPIELRRAVSDGEGNPTLMSMIRAAALRDAASLDRLAAALACPGR